MAAFAQYLAALRSSPATALQLAEKLLAAWAVWTFVRTHLTVDKLLAAVPGAKAQVSQHIESEARKAVADLFPKELMSDSMTQIPDQGLNRELVLQKLSKVCRFLMFASVRGHPNQPFLPDDLFLGVVFLLLATVAKVRWSGRRPHLRLHVQGS